MNFIKYLFNTNPGTEFKYYLPLGILVAILIIGGVALSVIYDHKKHSDFAFKRLFRKTSLKLFLSGILFLFLMGVRYENIPYFSMRIWLFLGLLILAYFIFKLIGTYLVEYKKEKLNTHHSSVTTETREVKKYLPNKKKR